MAGPDSPSCSEQLENSKRRQIGPKLGEHQEVAAPPPTTSEVRPAHCVSCGAAGRPVGAPLVIQGHGGRDRWLLGVIAGGGRPESVVVSGRRFRCLACGCVMLVVPCEVAPCDHRARARGLRPRRGGGRASASPRARRDLRRRLACARALAAPDHQRQAAPLDPRSLRALGAQCESCCSTSAASFPARRCRSSCRPSPPTGASRRAW